MFQGPAGRFDQGDHTFGCLDAGDGLKQGIGNHHEPDTIGIAELLVDGRRYALGGNHGPYAAFARKGFLEEVESLGEYAAGVREGSAGGCLADLFQEGISRTGNEFTLARWHGSFSGTPVATLQC